MNARSMTLAMLGAVLLNLASPERVQAGETLRLRAHDISATPGSVAAVVVRTYASRPIRQGQICFIAWPFQRQAGMTGPFAALEGVTVFSDAEDAVPAAELLPEGPGQTTMLHFESASATVNASDGPMLALYYRLRDDLSPGDQFAVTIDLANTFLTGPDGEAVPIEPRDAELRIVAASDPVSLSAASEAPQGGGVLLGVQTDRLLDISSGQFGLRLPPALLSGRAKVFVDPRYGNASVSVSYPRGLVLVNFESPDISLGQLPGDIVGLFMKIDMNADPAASRRIWLDPAHTFLYDGGGAALALDLDDDWIPLPARSAATMAPSMSSTPAKSHP